MARPTANAAVNAPGPAIFTTNSPTKVATTCPPISGRGCAASISGEPMTSTIEGEGHQHEGEGGALGQEFHQRDSDCAASGAGDDRGHAPHGWIGLSQGAPCLLLTTSGSVRSPKATDGRPQAPHV